MFGSGPYCLGHVPTENPQASGPLWASQYIPIAAPAAAQTVTVAMRDPGCHWFQQGQSFTKSMSVTGPVNLQNSDEAALKVNGSSGVQNDPMGGQVSLTPGSYTITMVGQAPDDNTLHLQVD